MQLTQEPANPLIAVDQTSGARKYFAMAWNSIKGRKNVCLWPGFREKCICAIY